MKSQMGFLGLCKQARELGFYFALCPQYYTLAEGMDWGFSFCG